MGRIIDHPGTYRLVFPDGSVLNGCRKRSYDQSTYTWFLFHGRQFNLRELDRWGVKVEVQDPKNPPANSQGNWFHLDCPKCGAKAGEHCNKLRGLWTGRTVLLYPHKERRELAKQGAQH